MELTTSKEIGIYCIHNRVNDFVYFGSAANYRGFRGRQMRHISDLNKNKHHSWLLQRDWKRYSQDVFDFHIVEICSKEQCAEFERNWISIRGIGEENKSYNISPDCFPAYDIVKTTKNWTITYPNGKQENITNLEKFCRENNLDAAHMGAVANGKEKHHKGFVCDYLDLIRQEEGIIKRNGINKKFIYPKTALFISPDKIEYIIESQGINKFAKEQNLDASCLRDLAKGEMLIYRGWEGGYIDKNNNYTEEVIKTKIDRFNKSYKCYKLINCHREIVEAQSLKELANLTKMSVSTITQLRNGKRQEYNGWRLIND